MNRKEQELKHLEEEAALAAKAADLERRERELEERATRAAELERRERELAEREAALLAKTAGATQAGPAKQAQPPAKKPPPDPAKDPNLAPKGIKKGLIAKAPPKDAPVGEEPVVVRPKPAGKSLPPGPGGGGGESHLSDSLCLPLESLIFQVFPHQPLYQRPLLRRLPQRPGPSREGRPVT